MTPMERRAGIRLALVAAIGVVVAIYLTATKLAGVAPICGPSGGCETVETSQYSAIAGIPVAIFGLGYSLVLIAVWLAWWRGGNHQLLYVPYVLGLIGVLVEAYLVYLELFVIHAVCLWCTAYGVTVVVGAVGAWVVAWKAQRA